VNVGNMSPNDSRSWHRWVSIRANDDRFQVIFDSVRDGIFIADPTTGRIIEANRAGCAMFDYSMDELIGGDIGMLSSGAPAYTPENAIEKHKKVGPGENITFEWQCKRRDGHLFWAEVSLSHATIGGIGSNIAIVRDISERKRLYEELQLCWRASRPLAMQRPCFWRI